MHCLLSPETWLFHPERIDKIDFEIGSTGEETWVDNRLAASLMDDNRGKEDIIGADH
jgi:hypothetical protein